ncbi:MAG: competence/damage-inducible protein A [Bacteroidota bacterium]
MQKEIKAEIITIGDEILYGQIIDTNSSWIGAALSDIGIKTVRRSSVGDIESEILNILDEATQRVDLVIVTGGLGPTKDDITKKTFCKYFNSELELNQKAFEEVSLFFKKRGRELTGLNLLQAHLPKNCEYVPNTHGTAPCMWFEENNTIYISMPGVPSEMKGIMTDQILQKLKTHFHTPVIYHKIIKTIGLGESFMAELIADWEDNLPQNIRLAYLPSYSELKLRLTCTGNDLSILEKQVTDQIEKLKKIIPQYIFGYDNDDISTVIGKLLIHKKLTISVAESCTGGYLGHLFTSISGSSAYFTGGIISYANEVKHELLGVSDETLESEGAVSEATIIQMAKGVRKKLNTTIGLATSGIAGPDGGTPEKPVGTVWIALATENEIITKKLQLGGSREQNIHFSAINLLNLLRKYLLKEAQL